MLQEHLSQSVMRLIEEFGISYEANKDVKLASIDAFRRLLRGSDYRLEKIDVIKGTFSYGNRVRGGIFFSKDHHYVPFKITSDAKIILLQKKEEGNTSEPERMEDLSPFTHAWVLVEKKILFNGLSPFFRHYSGRLWDMVAAAFLINLFALAFPLFSSFVYDKILGNGIYETLWALAGCLFIILAIEYFVRLVRLKTAERFAVSTETDIDFGIFKKLLEMKSNKIPSVATLLEKYKQILSYRDFLSSSYLLSLADIPFLALFLIAITVTAGPMVLIVVVFGLLILTSSTLMLKPVLDHENVAKIASEKRFSLLSDLTLSREAIIGRSFQKDIQDKLKRSSVDAAVSSSKARYWRGVSGTLANSLSYLSYVSVLVMGVYMIEDHSLTSGGLLAVSMMSSRAMSSLSSVANLILRYKEFKVALKSLESMLPDVLMEGTYAPRGTLNGEVHFENVTCVVREGQAPVLDSINIRIGAGEIVGIAGAPGAGKTTLLRLLVGALSPDKGRVLIDNIPVDRLSPDDVSANIGYKPQELCVLEGCIEDNVRAGRAPLDADTSKAVLMASGLEFAFRESGLNWQSDVGTRGSKLSGGQRQLVSLARAMAYHPRILVLDEPTNGLDANLEAHLARQIGALRGKTTVIVSSHSHKILSECDRIIVVGQSRILADGPRDKIMLNKA